MNKMLGALVLIAVGIYLIVTGISGLINCFK